MLLAAALGIALPTHPAAAQQGVECPAGRIEHIFIDNHSIFDTSNPELDPRFRWVYAAANRLHARTREHVIRRELLFRVGDCYDALLLEESERLLRSHAFIARVDIYALQQPGGGYHVVVDTEDEWSTQVEVRADLSGGLRLKGLDVRERNLAGYGRELGFFHRSHEAVRTYGVNYATPQLFGTRWDGRAAAGRTRSGVLVQQEIAYPFLGEAGRWGFRQILNHHDRLFDYVAGTGEDRHRRVLVPVQERAFSMASLWRTGRPGNLTLLGGGFSYQELAYPGGADAITLVEHGDYDGRVPAPPELRSPAAARMEAIRNIRSVVLLGKRNIVWQRRSGLDSFRGQEDVRVGAEVEFGIARSLPIFGSDDDLYGSMDFYVGGGSAASFFATRLRADARRDYAALDDYEMKDVFTEGEAFLYLRPSFLEQHTLLLRVAAAGGWHVRTPFQLTLGGERSLRGWREETLPGGRRIVLTAEDRWYLGWPFPDIMDLGTSLFLDIGRIWPGEAPFGIDSGWQGSLGAGIRANFPAGGTSTFRIDAAFPIGADGGLGRLQLLIGVGEYLGISSSRTDPQFSRSRIPPVTGTLYQFQ